MSSSANFKTKIKNYLTVAIKDQKELKKTLLELEENPETIIKKMLRTRFELFAYYGLHELCKINEVFGFFPDQQSDYTYLLELCYFFTSIAQQDGRFFLVNMPPRFGKTEIIKLFVCWAFGRNPYTKILYLSYSSELANDAVTKISSYMKNPMYKSIFPNVVIDKNLDNRSRFQTLVNNMPAGELYSAGVTGTITGFGAGNQAGLQDLPDSFKFSGAIIIDDPIKSQEAKSVTTRDSTWEAIKSTILSRKNLSSVPIVMVMQRLDVDDPAGRFILRFRDNPDFRHLCLKALQNDGTAICPAKMPAEDLQELQERDPETFYAQYQQEPTLSSNKIFNVSNIVRLDQEIEDHNVLKSFVCIDTAEKDTKNADYTVFGHFYLIANKGWSQFVKRDYNGRPYINPHYDSKIIKLVLNEIYVKKIAAHQIGEEFDYFFNSLKHLEYIMPTVVLVEEQGSGTALIGYVKKKKEKKEYYESEFLITGIRQHNNKLARMRAVSQLVTEGCLAINHETKRNFVTRGLSSDIDIITHLDLIENKDNKKDDIADVITYGLECTYQSIISSDNKILGNFFRDAKDSLCRMLF